MLKKTLLFIMIGMFLAKPASASGGDDAFRRQFQQLKMQMHAAAMKGDKENFLKIKAQLDALYPQMRSAILRRRHPAN